MIRAHLPSFASIFGLAAAFAAVALLATPLRAQGAPNLLHLQARIADASGAGLNGPVIVETRIYAVASGGVALWSESQPASALNGVVNLLLGSSSSIPATLFDGSTRYLALRVGADPEMTPRRPIASVPFASVAGKAFALDAAASIPAGVVASAQILDGSVAAVDLASGAVTGAKLAAASVDGSKIVDGSIGAADLASPISGGGATTPVLYATATDPFGLTHAILGTATGAGGTGVRGQSTTTTGFGKGIWASSASPSGFGVYAENSSSGFPAYALYGRVVSPSGTAVYGLADTNTGSAVAVQGDSYAPDGVGVSGIDYQTTGFNKGVFGMSNSPTGTGVYGTALAATGATYGVYGLVSSNQGCAVYGHNTATAGPVFGVLGRTHSVNGIAIAGADEAVGGGGGVEGTSFYGEGVGGSTFTASQYGVHSYGNFGCTGMKMFVQPHPTDASKEIRFVSLEGLESGTYFRGSSKLVGGRATIEVPEAFRLASDTEGLTVQLTPVGRAQLWVESEGLETIVVAGDRDVTLHYLVNGVRRGFAKHEPIRDNASWKPKFRGVPFGTQYPAEVRAMLVANGTLNADFTPNEATAAKLGWTLRDASEDLRFRPIDDDAARVPATATASRPAVAGGK